MRCDQAEATDVLAASACLFVMPEMLGSMAGRMKDFFDRVYYGVLDRMNGRPYGIIVSAGSDGQGAVRQAERIATGWRMRRVVEPLIVCTDAQTPERILAPKVVGDADRARAGEVGATLALGLQMGLW
jgi:multimeric flavodoxin WrbA